MADITTLDRLAQTLEDDSRTFHGLNPAAMRSVACIIRDAIGAPIAWPSRVAGAVYADDHYPGSNRERAVFNHGVKWAVEHYQPTIQPSDRFPTPPAAAKEE